MEREVVLRKLAAAAAWIDDVERRLAPGLQHFLDDADTADLAAFHLQLAMQECLDLAAHWIVSASLPPPTAAAAAFDTLAGAGLIPVPLAVLMRGGASLRNRIAHGYGSIDRARLYADVSDGLPGLRAFLAAVAAAAGL
ncbi:MAG: DUF86 domain-containing protein [Deltaproteobacteria bacterium]|nr:DUF86 domain-containing protein [Deltaproteobacteria bacterium]